MRYLYYHSLDPLQEVYHSVGDICRQRNLTVRRGTCNVVEWQNDMAQAYDADKEPCGYIERDADEW